MRTMKVTCSRSISLIFPTSTSRWSAFAFKPGSLFSFPFLKRHRATFGPLVEALCGFIRWIAAIAAPHCLPYLSLPPGRTKTTANPSLYSSLECQMCVVHGVNRLVSEFTGR